MSKFPFIFDQREPNTKIFDELTQHGIYPILIDETDFTNHIKFHSAQGYRKSKLLKSRKKLKIKGVLYEDRHFLEYATTFVRLGNSYKVKGFIDPIVFRKLSDDDKKMLGLKNQEEPVLDQTPFSCEVSKSRDLKRVVSLVIADYHK